MPNHIHLIVKVGCDPVNTNKISVDTVIGLLKSGITKDIHAYDPNIRVWQRSFHDHVIRTREGYEKIWQYIHFNAQKWSEDCFFSDSATDDV